MLFPPTFFLMPKIIKSYFHLSQVCQLKKLMEWMPSMIWFSSLWCPLCAVFLILNSKKCSRWTNQLVPGDQVQNQEYEWEPLLWIGQTLLAITYWHLLLTIHESYSNYNLALYHCFQVLQSCKYSGFSVSKPYPTIFSGVGFSLVSSNWNMPFCISCCT